MNNAGRVDVFETTLSRSARPCGKWNSTNEDLIEEILNELLLKRTRGEQTVKIGTKKLGDEVADDR
jgi:hypothetical protein